MPIPKNQSDPALSEHVFVRLIIMFKSAPDKISFEHELHVSSKITISTIERWIYGWYPTLRNKPIRYYHSGNEINPDVDLVSMDFNSQLQIICEFQQ
ncbi:hypothetical protein DERP_005415 [Dermatophagoides pteronyssinus]|uniref:Uncharacterized protein n=1 Tax=Dermatophagoides pteronyssinus TaxID=6956 RepID=A0ABQ8JMJ0_DERPT|nr:hypothetical protein DERP_005415 [Dermatophagoides pteronyssinus]